MFKKSNVAIIIGLYLALLASGSSAATANQCAVHNKLVKLVFYSDQFLDELSGGHHPDAPDMLEKFLKQTPTGPLRLEMKRASLQRLEQMAFKIIAEQMSLLNTKATVGRNAAENRAVNIGAYQNLREFRKRLAAASCDGQGSAGAAEGGGAEDREFTSSIAVSLLALPALVIIALLYLIEMRSKFKKRQSKRYPCNLDCTYTQSNRSHQVAIIDISCIGARLRTDVDCHPGDTANMRIGQVNLNVHVQWKNATYVGVQFTKVFPTDILQGLLSRCREQKHQTAVPQPT